MTWADQQRTVPPPGEDYASSQARRAWASAGAGPFGIADVGLPPASGAMAGLPSPEPRPSAASGGAGLPPTQFLQQPPGSASFLDASTQVSVREVVPVSGAVAPVEAPLWRMGPGGGLPPGLRVPFGEVLSPTPFLESPFSFERVTGFDPEWGEPPTVEALAWNPERALYEPSDDPRLSGAGVSGYTGSAHVPGYLKHFHAHYVDMASRQMYVQAYRDATGTGSWSFRWVRATTPWPEVTAPYVVMGPYERFALATKGAPLILDNESRIPEAMSTQVVHTSQAERKSAGVAVRPLPPSVGLPQAVRLASARVAPQGAARSTSAAGLPPMLMLHGPTGGDAPVGPHNPSLGIDGSEVGDAQRLSAYGLGGRRQFPGVAGRPDDVPPGGEPVPRVERCELEDQPKQAPLAYCDAALALLVPTIDPREGAKHIVTRIPHPGGELRFYTEPCAGIPIVLAVVDVHAGQIVCSGCDSASQIKPEFPVSLDFSWTSRLDDYVLPNIGGQQGGRGYPVLLEVAPGVALPPQTSTPVVVFRAPPLDMGKRCVAVLQVQVVHAKGVGGAVEHDPVIIELHWVCQRINGAQVADAGTTSDIYEHQVWVNRLDSLPPRRPSDVPSVVTPSSIDSLPIGNKALCTTSHTWVSDGPTVNSGRWLGWPRGVDTPMVEAGEWMLLALGVGGSHVLHGRCANTLPCRPARPDFNDKEFGVGLTPYLVEWSGLQWKKYLWNELAPTGGLSDRAEGSVSDPRLVQAFRDAFLSVTAARVPWTPTGGTEAALEGVCRVTDRLTGRTAGGWASPRGGKILAARAHRGLFAAFVEGAGGAVPAFGEYRSTLLKEFELPNDAEALSSYTCWDKAAVDTPGPEGAVLDFLGFFKLWYTPVASWRLARRVLRALIEQGSRTYVLLVGHSLGAYACIRAAQLLSRVGIGVDEIVSYDCVWHPQVADEWKWAHPSVIERPVLPDSVNHVQSILAGGSILGIQAAGHITGEFGGAKGGHMNARGARVAERVRYEVDHSAIVLERAPIRRLSDRWSPRNPKRPFPINGCRLAAMYPRAALAELEDWIAVEREDWLRVYGSDIAITSQEDTPFCPLNGGA